MRLLFLFIFSLGTGLCPPHAAYAMVNDPAGIQIQSSNKKLERAFNWAVDMALSHVQTRKSGVVDRWEKGDGSGNVGYIPCYWGGYNSRTAFYSRDICHQLVGGHLLDLKLENFTMLREFAKTSNAERKWYPLWALNFDGSPFKLDYRNDSDFVREVPAAFELVDKAYQLYLWTGDKNYIEDETLWNYYSRIVNEFITLHDNRIPNGVAEGDGSGDIFKGSATFNEEWDIPMVEAGDGIACQYRAFEAFAMIAKARNNDKLYNEFKTKAENLRIYFNTKWSVKPGTKNLVRGYNLKGKALTNWGKENSWFMVMKGVAEPSERTENYIDFIDKSAGSKKGKPSNIEARSYLPETFFNNNRIEQGWKWMEDIINNIDIQFPVSKTTGDGNYPEISFVLVSNVVEGLMGIEPNAPEHRLASISRLPDAIPDLLVENINIGNSLFSLSHLGSKKSTLTYQSGQKNFTWEIRFYGEHPVIKVNEVAKPAQHRVLNGSKISFITEEIKSGETIEAKTD
jgi:hypothetical protein